MQHFQFGTAVFFLLFLEGCTPAERPEIPAVTADRETTPVHSTFLADAADDIAFWLNPAIPAESLIFGTDKDAGIATYDLRGRELDYLKNGRPNNIDLRSTAAITLVACSERLKNEVLVYRLDTAAQRLRLLTGSGLKNPAPEIYGFCLYRHALDQKIYAFANSKNGIITQWRLEVLDDDRISGEIVRRLRVKSQPEGMVADDQTGHLYVGEERRGIWRFEAAPDGLPEGEFIGGSGRSNHNIRFDIEGLAIYSLSDTSGYLLASSQGNNSYAVFQRLPPNNYLGSFRVRAGKLDATSDTDGIEAVAAPLGAGFPQGLFIAQDGANDDGGKPRPQNFKLVHWGKIANLFEPPLKSVQPGQ